MNAYAKDDVRSRLTPAPPARTAVDPAAPVRPAQFLDLRAAEPAEVSGTGSKTWLARASNAVLSWTDAVAGERLPRVARAQADEYAIVLYSGSAPIRVTAGEQTAEVAEEALVVVPPGGSVVETLGDGPVIRLFSVRGAADLAAAAANAAVYAEPDERCAPLDPWPDPVGGFRLRVYRLADHRLEPGRFGRIFRTTNLMVNFLAEQPAPRETRHHGAEDRRQGHHRNEGSQIEQRKL